jgi:putative ABC transport system permease protein
VLKLPAVPNPLTGEAVGQSSRFQEAMTITGLGAVGGYLVYTAILTGTMVVIKAQTGVVLDAMRFDPILVWTPVAMIVLGAIAGVVPAVKAYRTDVASNLLPLS